MKVQEYLETKNLKTRIHYQRGFDLLKKFMESKGMNPSLDAFLSHVEEDRRLRIIERKHPEISLINSFIDHLSTVKTKKAKKGLAPKTINMYIAGISDFFNYCELPVQRRNLRIPANIPKPNNKKLNIRQPEIRKMLEHCVSNRDKAIVLCLWYGGMSISDLLNLSIQDVLDGDSQTGSLEDPPLLINIVRKKTKVQYRTFFGRDACYAIKRYLDERKQKYGKYSYSDPLFIKFRSKTKTYDRLDICSVEGIFKRLTKRSGLVTKERAENADLNPARPHAIRMGFSSVLREAQCNSDLINYWMGHKVSYDSAYFNYTDGQLRKEYKKYEKVLNIEKVPVETAVINQELSLLKKEHKLLTKILWHLAMENENFDLDPESSLGVLLSCMNEKGEIAEGMIDQVLDLKISKKLKGGDNLERE
jgi:integrase